MTQAEIPLLETALWTREIIGRFDAASGLRAAALVTLNEVDGRLATLHGTRLLSDAHEMSGEPAVTAARLLAAQDQLLPLYALVAERGGTAEVRAESLRGADWSPGFARDPLLVDYRDEADETILLGLFDLLLAHPSRATFSGFLASSTGPNRSTSTGLS